MKILTYSHAEYNPNKSSQVKSNEFIGFTCYIPIYNINKQHKQQHGGRHVRIICIQNIFRFVSGKNKESITLNPVNSVFQFTLYSKAQSCKSPISPQ